MKRNWVGSRFGLWWAGSLGWCLALCGLMGADLPGVQLRLTTREMDPTTRFEVVFEEPMVGVDQIGAAGESSPLRVDPPIEGEFVWRSRRVGMFQPTVPLGLDTTYRFQLRPGVRTADGRTLSERLRRDIQTPPVSVVVQQEESWKASGLPAFPTVLIAANAVLNPEDLAARSSFRSGPRRIRANVEPVEFEDWEKRYPNLMLPPLTWVDRFQQATEGSRTSEVDRESGAAFWIRPMEALVSTSSWMLHIERGVRTADGRVRLKEEVRESLGVSPPLTLEKVDTVNELERGRELELTFSRPVDRVSATNWTRWIQIEPEAADLKVRAQGDSVVLGGGFGLDQSYVATLGPGLVSEDGVPLSVVQGRTNAFKFDPIQPRVWLPGFSEVQLLAGHRNFEIRSVNAGSVTLRVKALSREALVPGLNGYNRMLDAQWWNSSRSKAPMDYAALPGRTVLETNIVVTGAIDELVRTPLGWDTLVGTGRAGAFFVEADLPRDGTSKGWGPQTLVQLTDLGFVLKQGGSNCWIWVVSQKTAQPLKGVAVSLRDAEDGEVASGVTDGRGLVVLPKQESARWVVLESGTDVHVAPMREGHVGTWGMGLPPKQWNETGLTLWSFTDRQAYRPGEPIHLHAQVRLWKDGDWSFPAVDGLKLTVEDPRGQVVLTTNLVVSARGSCDWQGALPEGPRGTYDLTLTPLQAPGQGPQRSLRVEIRDFQPPAFEVRIDMPSTLPAGTEVSAGISARYLLGAPVTKGRLQWHAEAEDLAFQPEGWGRFVWPGPDSGVYGIRETGTEGQVDVTGTHRLENGDPVRILPSLPGNQSQPTPQKISVVAEVTDLNQQTVSQVAEAVRHASDFYLGFQWAGGRESIQKVGETPAFHVVAAASDGTPWTRSVPIQATLRRIDWKTAVVERAGGGLAHEQRREAVHLMSQTLTTTGVAKRGAIWDVMKGQVPSNKGEDREEDRGRGTDRDKGTRDKGTGHQSGSTGAGAPTEGQVIGRGGGQADKGPGSNQRPSLSIEGHVPGAPEAGEGDGKGPGSRRVGTGPAAKASSGVPIEGQVLGGGANPDKGTGHQSRSITGTTGGQVLSNAIKGQVISGVAGGVSGFTVDRPGAYEIELVAVDARGRPVKTVVAFTVDGDARLAWKWKNGSQLGLVPDRTTLEPGTPAEILVEAPFSGTALITVERESVRNAFVTPLTGNAPSIRVPLGTNASPNSMVGVFLIRGLDGNPHEHPMPEWRAGWVNLTVPDRSRLLGVSVGLSTNTAQPGQDMGVTVSVRTHDDAPAAGAEVTLYAVDEGFLQLLGTPVPDPNDFWWAERALSVETTQSFRNLLEEDPELLEFSNKGDIGGGGGRRGLSQRRRFVPCPLWEGSRVTDDRGQVVARFTVPDSLTRYRVVAVVAHGARQFGSAASTFEVRKPLMMESGLPRFLHVGDRLTARALVLNTTGASIEARVSLTVPTNGVVLEGSKAVQTVVVPAGGSIPVDVPIIITGSSDAEWIWRVESPAAADEVVARIPVTRGIPDLVTGVWARAGRNGTNLVAALDPAALEAPRTATVRVASGPLAFGGGAVDWLSRYPYRCVEQTSAMLVPLIVAARAPGLLGPVDSAEVTRRVEDGIRQLWSMQLGSGLLSSWPGGSDAADWGSAYAAWVLRQASAAGFSVDSTRRERLVNALAEIARTLPSDPRWDGTSLGCFLAAVLADSGRPDPSLNAALINKADELSPTSRAFLAWALAVQDPRDADLKKEAVRLLMAPTSRWDQKRLEESETYWDPARLPAVRFLAGQRLGLDAATLDRDLVALLAEGRGGAWATTQGNAWALWAMATDPRSTPDPPLGGTWSIASQSEGFELTREHPMLRRQVIVDSTTLAAGLQIRSDSDRPVLVQAQVTAENRIDPARAQPVDRGLGIHRTYERLDDENRPGPIDGLRVGDRVLVTLRLDVPEDVDWLAVEDPIPAVLEPVQGVFRTEGRTAHPLIPEWSSDFREIRRDRVRHFKKHVPEGIHWIRYLARVRSVGDVVTPPARAEAMYDPDRFGHSAGGRFQTAP